MIKTSTWMLTGLFAVVMLLACAAPQVKVEPIPTTAKPAEQVSALERDIVAARTRQLDVLAPGAFEKADKYLAEARRSLEEGGEIADILDNVSYGKAHLRQADEAAALAKTALADVIESREFARATGATLFEKDYAEAEKDFLRLTEAVEEDNVGWAKKHKAEVSEAFRMLELRAIKEQTLGEVRSLLDEAEKAGAKKAVPATFEAAKVRLEEVDAFITENPYEKEKMHEMAAAALFQARRLQQIMQQSTRLRDMEPEKVALVLEDVVYRATEKLAAPDMRDQAFDTQVENLVGSITALRKDHAFVVETAKARQVELESERKKHLAEMEELRANYAAETEALQSLHSSEMEALRKEYLTDVAALNKEVAALQGATREEQAARERLEAEKRAEKERLEAERMAAEAKLEAERRFNALYTDVQSLFTAEEAEVYKKGANLVIRLRAVRFPVGKEIIMPENYALLSKVQRAIRVFGEPNVVVEGHTDTTGSDALNDHLSQLRAEAVREYFVANGTVSAEGIMAVGFGSKRPLASNETPEGRAINRRIDVIIAPQSLTAH